MSFSLNKKNIGYKSDKKCIDVSNHTLSKRSSLESYNNKKFIKKLFKFNRIVCSNKKSDERRKV